MKHLFIFLAIFNVTLLAQRPASDSLKTTNGQLLIQPIFHGSLVFTWNNKTIYVDPYGGQTLYEGLTAPDLVLITDIHPDHLDLKTLEAINMDKATFVVPQAVADKLSENLKKKMIVLSNEKTTEFEGIAIKAIAMYNLPEAEDSKHTKGRGNGYVLNVGGKTVYLSGDSEDIPEMRQLKNIDVAFVCMNLPYTMDINQAASAVLDFKPKVVYPYHYRGKDGLSDVEKFKTLVNSQNSNIEVRLRNWYEN
jgi:L-ascorbate metabolism protein UlaG (beta-lactamase superfamily)